MITDINILWIALTCYLLGLGYALFIDKKAIMFISILWFIPVLIIDNLIIIVFSIIMFILHIIIPMESKGDEF